MGYFGRYLAIFGIRQHDPSPLYGADAQLRHGCCDLSIILVVVAGGGINVVIFRLQASPYSEMCRARCFSSQTLQCQSDVRSYISRWAISSESLGTHNVLS